MRGKRLGLALLSAMALLATSAGSAIAETTPEADYDNFSFSGMAQQPPTHAGFQMQINSCKGISLSMPGEPLTEGPDVEYGFPCSMTVTETVPGCTAGPSGPTWNGTISVSELGSDSYDGFIQIQWNGPNGLISGTVSETESGVSTGEFATISGNIMAAFPPPPNCFPMPWFPVSGGFSTNA